MIAFGRSGPRRRARLISLSLLGAGLVATLVWANPAGAAPRRPDLVIENMVPDQAYPAIGDTFSTRVDVQNNGTAESDPVSVTVTLPPELQPATPAGVFTFAEWQCLFGTPSWTCTRASLEAGAATTLILSATVVSGQPDDVLTISGRVAPSRREVSIDNNANQTSVTIAGHGTIRGTVWSDLDRDGQREAGEPPVGSGPDGVQRLAIIPLNAGETGGAPTVVVVAPDGTYSATMKSGLYIVQILVSADRYYFTYPNVGDDATDSDIVHFEGDGTTTAGSSDPVTVSEGSDDVVDAGLFDRTPA
jgi:hypothetical protein